MRLVAPYRPFDTTGIPHAEALAGFDWVDALRMLADSARQVSPDAAFHVLTDVDTDLPMPSLQYVTTRRALMLWSLEISACYLESAAFDCDTVALDADQLIYADLAKWFAPYMDLGIVVRPLPKNLPGLPILNGVQFWPLRGKPLLGPFYRRALAIAETLPTADQAWGADTIALARLLDPLDVLGIPVRDGLRVRFIAAGEIIAPLSEVNMRHLAAGKFTAPHVPVLDFRAGRKPYMRSVYEATIAREVPA